LTKTGSGTLTLGGDNSYTGPTTVEQGKLLVDGSTGFGAVSLATGTTLGGTNGTIQGTLSVANGAYVDPGSPTGVLTVNADTTLASGTTFTVDLNGTEAGTEYDQFAQNGAIHLNGATLVLEVGYTPTPADRYVLVDNDGADPIDGTFAGYANHAIVNVSGQDFRIFYDGGDGNDVVLVKTAALAVSTIHYDAGPNDVSDPSDSAYGIQRSTVTRIVVTFNGLVDTIDSAAAFAVDQVANGGVLTGLNIAYSEALVGENTQITLSFTGGDAYTYERPTGSGKFALVDANYRVTIDKDELTSLAGDMSADKVDDFYRWFGDTDGDRDADGSDMFVMRRVLASDPVYAKYAESLDVDGSGTVNGTDYSAFRTHYGRRLLPPT
jgi:autotransporter-associated beta strand protein